MDAFLELLSQYGPAVYAILFGYSALKSGSLPLFAGYAAHTSALNVYLVALATVAGGYLGDELRFAFAKTYGERWLNRANAFGRLFRHAQALATRYGKAYIFMYRYPKGLRTIGAFPVGLTDISWRQFTVLNASSAILWVTILVGGGYVFGATFDALGVGSFTAFTLLLLGLFLIALLRVWRTEKIAKEPNAS